MNVKVSTDLEWLKPYLKKVGHIVPVHTLEKIIAIKPNIEKVQHCHAQLVTESDVLTDKVKRRYISINLYFIKTVKLKPLQRKQVPFSKIDLLVTLAHELAHLHEDAHTPKHKIIESKICMTFMTMLERAGYTSEEHEMKHHRPRF